MKQLQRIALIVLVLTAGLTAVATLAQDEVENKGFMAAQGRVTFNRYCASCHGDKADGNGPVAGMLKIPPADLRALTIGNDGDFPAERVNAVIDGRGDVQAHGSRDMPVWGEVFQTILVANPAAPDESGEDRAVRKTRELVLFLETIQTAPNEPAPPAATETDEE